MSFAPLLLTALIAAAPTPAPPSAASASVEQCMPSANQLERSVTFAAQMTALPGTPRMAMEIDLQERSPTNPVFHTVIAPGLGIWRQSETGVKIYKYVKQLTNLTAPAVYRAQVHYRWFDEGGRLVRRAQRVTDTCVQPVDVAPTPARMPGA
jgi:hypothetical protein